jgi:hypothetical protein
MAPPPYLSNSLGIRVTGLGALPFLSDSRASWISARVTGASRASGAAADGPAAAAAWEAASARKAATEAATSPSHASSNCGLAAVKAAVVDADWLIEYLMQH